MRLSELEKTLEYLKESLHNDDPEIFFGIGKDLYNLCLQEISLTKIGYRENCSATNQLYFNFKHLIDL